MTKVFIDGSAGTTGLRIYERLLQRDDIQLILLPEEKRKELSARADAINSSDIVFLCLPDDAAREAVTLCKNDDTVIIDTSTAHRTNSEWTYGFPEINNNRDKISASKRIANPGCHASGFVALIEPLIRGGIIKNTAKLSCFSLTGYSGGGKKMIAEYESSERNILLDAPRMYGTSQIHKHLPEMKKICLLEHEPVFCPVVSDYYSGMQVTVPLFASDISGTIKDIEEIYKASYNSKIIHFEKNCDEGGFLSASALSGRDDMQISVFGNDERIILVSRFDNLGKGASGAAIQNMNIVLGIDETKGLVL